MWNILARQISWYELFISPVVNWFFFLAWGFISVISFNSLVFYTTPQASEHCLRLGYLTYDFWIFFFSVSENQRKSLQLFSQLGKEKSSQFGKTLNKLISSDSQPDSVWWPKAILHPLLTKLNTKRHLQRCKHNTPANPPCCCCCCDCEASPPGVSD